MRAGLKDRMSRTLRPVSRPARYSSETVHVSGAVFF